MVENINDIIAVQNDFLYKRYYSNKRFGLMFLPFL